jgi:glycosyltransferase involved in cell wall biosynthesis
MNEPVTAIFFSCRRLGLLAKTLEAFIKANTYPMQEIIIVNDSGDKEIHELLKQSYGGFTLVMHNENVGLIKSIDLGYAHIKTEYFFHCEDDWCCNGKGGFIEQSLDIMQSRPDIEEVWLADYNKHPIEGPVLQAQRRTPYRLAGHWDGWHGFTTACGLKRLSDYKKVAPYSDVKWSDTIWHRERAIGDEYHKLGYRTAILMDAYANNIGIGKSEYKTGYEI